MNSILISTQLDSIFQAFAHSKRRGMIYTLSFRPATVTQLANEFHLSLPAMHKHIRLLENAKLIHRKKVGRTNFVALNSKSVSLAKDWLSQFRTDWGSDSETLENYIANMHK
jgi:DNA-binding transcriptional ArsR family regulator